MTREEREQLSRFLELLKEAQAGGKDAEAEALIREAFARQPDAAYLLVQRTMQLEYALQAAQQEVAPLRAEAAQLRAELDKARLGERASSFLAGPNTWGRRPGGTATSASVQPAVQSAVQPFSQHAAQQPAGPAAPGAARPSAWGSGLMGTVASTAAGVVAGSLLYQGIGSLMGSHNKDQSHDKSAAPPGGGTVDNADRYGDSSADQSADGGYVAEDFDTSDSGDMGDVG